MSRQFGLALKAAARDADEFGSGTVVVVVVGGGVGDGGGGVVRVDQKFDVAGAAHVLIVVVDDDV